MMDQRRSTSFAIPASPPRLSALAAEGGEVSLCRGSCWLIIHGARSTPSPCRGIRQVPLSAWCTGQTFKNHLTPSRNLAGTPQCPEHWMDLQNSLSLSRRLAASVRHFVLNLALKPIPSHRKSDLISLGIPHHYSVHS